MDMVSPFRIATLVYQKTQRWLPWLAVLTLVLLAVGLIWGLAYAPEDARKAIAAELSTYMCPHPCWPGWLLHYGDCRCCWPYLAHKTLLYCDALSGAIGCWLTFIALFTGAVWGKPTWGTYWVWDARITSMLILLFLYLGVLVLRHAYSVLRLQIKPALFSVCGHSEYPNYL